MFIGRCVCVCVSVSVSVSVSVCVGVGVGGWVGGWGLQLASCLILLDEVPVEDTLFLVGRSTAKGPLGSRSNK